MEGNLTVSSAEGLQLEQWQYQFKKLPGEEQFLVAIDMRLH